MMTETKYTADTIKYLRLLSEKYPTSVRLSVR